MLLRAGLIYILSVLTVLLGIFAAWQHLDISLRDESAAALSKRITTLQSDLSALSRREEAAIRRARVAEDSLTRNENYNTSDAVPLNELRDRLTLAQREQAETEEIRKGLEADLAQATKERDQIRVERDELQRAREEARVAAGKALHEADAARQELSDLKTAASAVTAATPPPPAAVSPDIAVETPAPPVLEAAVAPDELVRPAADTSPAKSSEVNSSEVKSTLVPSAVTIEPVQERENAQKRTEKSPAAKRDTVKSKPRRLTKSKPATVSSSAAKKPPKQAKKDEPFFPF